MTNFLRRRDIAKSILLGVAATAVPAAAHAAENGSYQNVIFTKDNPGHWAGKEGGHVPVATVLGDTLTVKTPHPMSDAHFIVSHTVVLDGGRYLERATFTSKDQPVSTHTLPTGYKGGITVTSACNLHDLWAANITV
jgi:superoxide reductase